MSTRVSAAPHAAASTSGAGAASSTAAARAASLLDAGGPVHPDGGPGAEGADNAGAESGSRAPKPFATALANATRSGTTHSAATGGTQSPPPRSGAVAASPTPAQAASSARAPTSAPSGGAAQAGTSAQTTGPTTPSNAAAAVAAAMVDVTDSADDTATTGSNAPVDDATNSDAASGTSAAPASSHGSHRTRGAPGSNSGAIDPWGALAMLQGLAASIAAPSPFGNSTVDAGDDAEQDGSGGDVNAVLSGAAGAASGTAATAGANSGASVPATADPVPVSSLTSNPVDTTAGQILANLLSGTGGNAAAGTSTHGTAASAEVTSDSSAAARIATLLPQFLAAAPAGGAGVTRAIAVPMSDPSWPQALAAQVHWMAGSQVQSATLRLSPEHLGPVQVRIELQQSQINVSFSAAHAETRSALADAVPRLRELLASGGLSLGQASVQQESAGTGSGPAPIVPIGRENAETVDPVAVGAVRALGLVDEYV